MNDIAGGHRKCVKCHLCVSLLKNLKNRHKNAYLNEIHEFVIWVCLVFGKSNEEKASHLHHKGVNLSKKEKFEEALECFDEAISIEPEVWDFWFSKGSALSELERFEEALSLMIKQLF